MRFAAGLAAALVAAVLGTPSASAATITVDTTADEYDVVADMDCSLREAVQSTNANAMFGGCDDAGSLVSQDVISLPAGTYALTLMGPDEEANATGDLDLSPGAGGVRLEGTGLTRPTIDGLLADRALDVHGAGDVELAGLRVFRGSTDLEAVLPVDEQVGGGLRRDGSVGSVSVDDSVLEQNSGPTGGAALALLSPGPHTVEDTVVSDSIAANDGAIYSAGALDVVRSLIAANHGGGLRVAGGPTASLTVTDSALVHNEQLDAGMGAIRGDGDVTVVNSTIHGNLSGFVGGISAPGDITVRFSTITENFGPEGISSDEAGGIDSSSADSVLLDGVILAGNFTGSTPSNCNEAAGVTAGPNPNLEGADTCGLGPPSQVTTDPQLDVLANNGGPTPTRGLYPGSPALDKAPACGFPTDQRGTPRTDLACDLGAFEGTVPRPVATPPAEPKPPGGDPKCKAKKRVCCSKQQKARGKPRWCRKKGRGKAKSPAKPKPRAAVHREVIGRSVHGRPLVAIRIGDPDAERVALVVGVIHGNEPVGLEVISRLRREWAEIKGTQIWLLKSLNPDGQRSGKRKNAHGVDLNRNFPFGWKPNKQPDSGFYPGPSPASEPETRAAMDFIRRIQPDVSIWYHQPWRAVLACRGRPAAGVRYSELSGMRMSCRGRGLPGTAISWQKDEFAGSEAFVVEFAGGPLPNRIARRHARAAALLARDGASGASARAAVPKPQIRKRLIPYPASRLNDMAGYSKRHYGERTYTLSEPQADRHPLRRRGQHRLDLQHLRAKPAGPGVRRAAQRLQPLRGRRRRPDRQVRAGEHPLPPRGRPQPRLARDRARRLQRRPGPGPQAPVQGVAAPHARPPLPLRHPRQGRDRAQREPLEPLLPGAGPRLPGADARGLQAPLDADLPPRPHPIGGLLRVRPG